MKMKTIKPLYLGGKTLVEGQSFITDEQHGRQLLERGYAELDEGKDEVVVDLTESVTEPKPMTSSGVVIEQKPGTKKPTEKKKAN